MPLLCISLLALLLLPLPLSLSCEDRRNPKEVKEDYMQIVQTDLSLIRESIETLLHSSPCSVHKLPGCLDNPDFVGTLHTLNCNMMNLRLSHTKKLATSVQHSIRCPCPERLTKDPNRKLKRGKNTRRNEQRKREKLCNATAILSTMTECYEMLSTTINDT